MTKPLLSGIKFAESGSKDWQKLSEEFQKMQQRCLDRLNDPEQANHRIANEAVATTFEYVILRLKHVFGDVTIRKDTDELRQRG